MGKKLLLFALISLSIFLSGCQTAKNTGRGLALIGQGVAADARSCYESLSKADRWFQDNYR